MNNCDTASCTGNISEGIRIAVGAVGITSCSLSLIGCLFAAAIIIIYKKYVFSVQRILLYLTISVFINVLGQLLDRVIFLYEGGELKNQTSACEFAGFVSQYSSWAILGSVCCSMFELLIGVFKYTESGKRLNLVYITLIFALPIGVNWIPFTVHGYGFKEWTCEIIIKKCCENYQQGIIMESVLWWIPLYATLFYMTVGYIAITIKLIYDKKCYTAMIELNRNRVYQNTYNDIMYLKYYPIIYMLINVLPLISDIYDVIHHEAPCQELWIPAAFIKGIQGGFITIAATLDPKTRKRLSFKELKMAFFYNVLTKQIAEEYPVINSSISDSLHPNNNKNKDNYGTNSY